MLQLVVDREFEREIVSDRVTGPILREISAVVYASSMSQVQASSWLTITQSRYLSSISHATNLWRIPSCPKTRDVGEQRLGYL